MSASAQRWMDSVESIVEEYAASDQMPDDFDYAVKRLVSHGLDQPEAATMLQEAVK